MFDDLIKDVDKRSEKSEEIKEKFEKLLKGEKN
jgi:hypothetical protein